VFDAMKYEGNAITMQTTINPGRLSARLAIKYTNIAHPQKYTRAESPKAKADTPKILKKTAAI
jgi:hypothetical protein